MPKKPTTESESETVQVVVSGFPRSLREEIEADAKKNNRSLAAEIRQMLGERLQERRRLQAA